MKNKLSLIALGLLLVSIPHNVTASPIVVSSTGNFNTWVVLYSGQAFGVSWGQTSSYENVSISAELTAFDHTTETGRAFLSTRIGPGTSLADQIAYTAFTFPSHADDLLLFSGLSLPAGQYYLSLVGNSGSWGSGWVGSDTPTLKTGAGVVLGTSWGFRSPTLSYLPSSAVYDGGHMPNFTVTGTPVPETMPTFWILAFVSLLFLALPRIKYSK